MTYARLSAVYGLSYTDICAMPLAAITAYIEAIPAALAERRLIAADGASVPYLKKPHEALRAWQRAAYGEAATKRRASIGEVMLLGISVQKVKLHGNQSGRSGT